MKKSIHSKSKKKLLLMIPAKGKTPRQVQNEAVRILKSKGMLNKHGELVVKEKSNKNDTQVIFFRKNPTKSNNNGKQ